MKLSFIREQVAVYDREKSTFRKFFGEYNEVKQLKQLVKQQGQSDRDVTVEELYKVFAILLPANQNGGATNEKVRRMLNRIRSHGGVEFDAALSLYQARPSLFNQENYIALLQQPRDLSKIITAWNKLPPNLQNLENMQLLQEQVVYIDELIELLSSTSCQAELSGNSAQVNFLRVCFLSMLEETDRKSSENPLENTLIKNLQSSLVTRANIKDFSNVSLANKKIRNHVITDLDIIWAKILRSDLLKSIVVLPATFTPHDAQQMFTRYCMQSEQGLYMLGDELLALPEQFRTVEHLKLLVSIKYTHSFISTFNSLAAPLQTNENFALLVVTAGSSETNEHFKSVYDHWNRLPPELQTQANFTMMHINSEQFGSVVYRSLNFFNSLGQQTQDNFTKLFSLEMDNLMVFEVRAISRDFFNRITPVDFANLDFNKLKMAASAWELLPEDLKTEVTFGPLVGNGEEHKGDNAAAVHFLFSVLPVALRTEENFNKLITHAKDICHFKAESPAVELTSIFSQIGTVVNQDLLNRIIQTAKNLDSDDISTLVQQFKAVDYIFRLVPPTFRSQEHLDIIFERAARIQLFRATPEAKQLSAILSTVPPHLFTPTLYNLVIQLTEATNQAALEVGLNRIRNQVGQQIGMVGINAAQSSHTASVHKSVSESAIRLMNRYGEQISTGTKLDYVIEQFKDWINSINVVDLGLNDLKKEPAEIVQDRVILSHQLEAARRAVVTLSNPVYAFIDPESQVSTRQLMALVRIALIDDKLCTAPQQDANCKMVVGLYDVQRGYNQTEDFTDSDHNAEDNAICTGGTFNKLVEIPWGIHPDVQMRYITTQLAGNKIPVATLDLVREYINELQQTEMDKAKFAELISKLNSDGIEVIWNCQIKPKLTKIIYDEYGSLYKGDKDQKFLDLIETGQYVDLSKLHLERYLKTPQYEERSESSIPTDVASPSSDAVDSTGMPSDAVGTSTWKMRLFALSRPTTESSWLSQVENRLDAVQVFDSTLQTNLLDLKQLAKQLDTGEFSLEHIGLLERNISRLIRDVRPNSERASVEQDAYQCCFATLSAIGSELEEIKQSMSVSRAGQNI